MRKALFFDIDGTLWDRQFQIPESTKKAIEEVKARGHLCFLCTGRTKNHIRDQQLLALGFDGMIAGCGTYIEYHHKVLFQYEIPYRQLMDTIRLLQEHHIAVLIEGIDYHYLNEWEFEGDPYVDVLKASMGDRLLSLKEAGDKIRGSKLTLEFKWEDWEKARSLFQDEYHVIEHTDWLAEMVPKGFDKAEGIKKACEILHIDWEDTIAFGDSANDLEMIQYAKIGVAMGNGSKEIKQAADYVTTEIGNHGIYQAVKALGLLTNKKEIE